MLSRLKFMNLRATGLTATALTALLALPLPASAVQEPGAAAAGPQTAIPSPSVIVFNQKPQDSSISLSYAYVPKKSFAVVHVAADGEMSDKIVGQVALEPGDQRNLKIKLSEAPKEGSRLWVVLHEDKDGNGTFDPKQDSAYRQAADISSTNKMTVL